MFRKGGGKIGFNLSSLKLGEDAKSGGSGGGPSTNTTNTTSNEKIDDSKDKEITSGNTSEVF